MLCDFSSGSWNSARIGSFCAALARRYPFLRHKSIGSSVMGTPLHVLLLGSGSHRVLINGAHHANEWITVPLLLRFVNELAAAACCGGRIFGADAGTLLTNASLAVIPAVNPDGIDLVTGALCRSPYLRRAEKIAAAYPGIPFPSGWKANIAGVDLNLQYPAGWAQAKINKFSMGFTASAPRDYVGEAPLSAPEARSLYAFTLSYSPALTLSYHTQGREIYWQFQDNAPPIGKTLALEFAALSSYTVADVPYGSGFAGYKDWFIQQFHRPGFTVEAGSGENPLPTSQFHRIYEENLGILVRSLRPFPV